MESSNRTYHESTVLITLPCLLVGGTEVQTLRLVEALISNKRRVVVACFFEYDTNVVEQYRLAGAIVTCFSAFGKRPKGIRKQFKFIHRGLKRTVRQYQPDIAHVQYVAPGAATVVALRLLHIKTIIATLHTSAAEYKSLRLLHLMQRHLVRVFTCVSNTAEKEFFGSSNEYIEGVIPARHAHITIPNCLPPKHKIFERQAHDRLTIGYVGRLEAVKGADMIAQIFSIINAQHKDCQFVIAGEGSLHHDIEEELKASNIATRVSMTGRLSSYELQKLYADIDILIVPSRREGFGLTALEAMSAGCVVVASAVGGLPEVVGSAGELVRTEDNNGIAQTVGRLINDIDKRKELSVSAQHKAQTYSFERYSNSIANLYKQLS